MSLPHGAPPRIGPALFPDGCPSPNHGPRRDGLRPDLVVLHYTAMSCPRAAARALCDPDREVSAHYLITRAGEVVPMVPEAARAWHAGAGEWGGRGDVNSRSIGIELDNDGASPFAEPLMRSLEELLGGILDRWDITPAGVIGHSDMAPGRKIDPGPRFDWGRLGRTGLSVWPEATGAPAPDPTRFASDLRRFGYPAMDADLALATLRQRFRPWARGPLAAEDMAIAAALGEIDAGARDP